MCLFCRFQGNTIKHVPDTHSLKPVLLVRQTKEKKMKNVKVSLFVLVSLIVPCSQALAEPLVNWSPTVIESTCVIPDHNGGVWGCDLIRIDVKNNFGRVDYLVFRNLSNTPETSRGEVQWTGPCCENFREWGTLEAIDNRDPRGGYLALVPGDNVLEVDFVVRSQVVARETIRVFAKLGNRF